jgi:RNA polymerase sigma factor (sigma-70 family)
MLFFLPSELVPPNRALAPDPPPERPDSAVPVKPRPRMHTMSHTTDEFQALLQRARDGSQEAARVLHDRYAGHVRDAVRKYLDDRVRGLFDSSDVTQEAWAAFFHDALHEQSFDWPENFLAFLRRVAHNKCLDVNRRYLDTQKNDVRRQYTYYAPQVCPEIDLVAHQPQPWEILMAAEAWDFLEANASPSCRPLVAMLREGYTPHEISKRLGWHPMTIQRAVEKLQKRLQRHEPVPV